MAHQNDKDATSRGGRGARERILTAAADLFAREGIHATGMAKLSDAAHVSTRTLYQHFPSKEALITAYVQHLEVQPVGPIALEAVLDRKDLSPRERLLGLFAGPPTSGSPEAVVRGCPLHNTVVEAAGAMPAATAIVERHKREFRARLIETAAELGAPDPEVLGRRLALIFEGSRALSASLNDERPIADARELVKMLIDSPVAIVRSGAETSSNPPDRQGQAGSQ
jgi:AcrR family transcriptional regulator